MKPRFVYLLPIYLVLLIGTCPLAAQPPNLTNWITSPNGGESFTPGASIPVSINGTLYTPPTVVVELYKGATRVWESSTTTVGGV